MHRHVRRIAVHAAGWTLVVLGVVGLVLPILPGLLLLLVGLSVLALEWDPAQRMGERLRERWGGDEHDEEAVRGWRKRVARWLPGRREE